MAKIRGTVAIDVSFEHETLEGAGQKMDDAINFYALKYRGIEVNAVTTHYFIDSPGVITTTEKADEV